MNHYELTYIIPMTYTVDEVPGITKKIAGFLTEQGATNLRETSLGKLKLAYQIDGLSHGYYQVVEFDGIPSTLLEITKNIKLSKEVLRYMLITKRIKSEKELLAEKKLKEKIAKQDLEKGSIFDEDHDDEKPRKPRVQPKPKKAEEEKVDIGELDKKLDAILGGEDMLQ